jgi:oligopeptide/dipeptide ABC transporter ATP-binding protein
MMSSTNDTLLSVRGLKTYFRTDAGEAKAVDGVSLDIPAGKTMALVGESGCGKSVTAMSVLRLIPQPPGRIADGEVLYEGTNLLDLSLKEMRAIRGNDISMIFQEPMTSLNPVFRIGKQIGAVLRLHCGLSKYEAYEQTIELLTEVGIPAPDQRIDEYPHQLSGGMRQRVMIAMALACNPKLLIADEPTTALDVTVQAQILDLLRKLQDQHGMAILLITHDLGIVAEMAHDVAVMYAGKIVEQAPVKDLFADPRHPYTEGLFKSLPSYEPGADRLHTIAGNVPAATHFPSACRFHPRCLYAMDRCSQTEPPLEASGDHHAACWLHDADAMAEEGLPTGIPQQEAKQS